MKVVIAYYPCSGNSISFVASLAEGQGSFIGAFSSVGEVIRSNQLQKEYVPIISAMIEEWNKSTTDYCLSGLYEIENKPHVRRIDA